MRKQIVVCSLIALFLLTSTVSVSSYVGEDIEAVLTDDAHSVPDEPESETRDLGDLQFIWGVENQTDDFQSIGCECDGTHFFVTGGNNGTDPNKVYIFDFDGNYVDSFDQQGTTGWGWLDLAWDGEYFYGGPEAGSRIDVFTDDGTVVDTIPGPVPWCAGLAYDPDTDHLWTIDKWTDKVLYEIDKDGNVINSYQQDKNVYGLAWDNISNYGPFIWVAVQDPQCTFYQFDPSTGDYTGVSFEAYNPGSTDNKACGLGFTTKWNTSAGVLFGIQQCDQTPDGPGDQLAGYMICEIGAPEPGLCCEGSLNWVDVKPETTVTGTFQVCNCGEEGSFLNWQFQSAPSWPGAIWEIEPDSGTGLAEGDCITITVNVTAPPDKNSEFTGKIKMINSDDPSDYCEIDVSLTTPRNKPFNIFQPFLRFLEQHPHMFPILRQLLGL